MKRALALLSLVPLVIVLSGCSEMTQEDREFYTGHWVHPNELDQERPTKMSPHPETTGSLGPAGTTRIDGSGRASDDTEWTPPQRY